MGHSRLIRRVALASACAFAGIGCAQARAATFTVTGMADAAGACTGTSCSSLRAALAAAQGQPGSTIQLGAGTYTLGNGPGAPVGSGQLELNHSTTITGAGPTATVIRQTDGQDRVFDNYYGGSTLTLENLEVTGGTLQAGASAPAAGILSDGPLSLDNVVVTGNSELGSDTVSPSGNTCCQSVGAIVTLSSLTLNHTTISNNTAIGSPATSAGVTGGQAVAGILATLDAQLMVTDSTFSGNTATGGSGGASPLGVGGTGGDAFGAIFVIDGAPLTIVGSRFTGNTATAGVGGTGLTGGTGGSAYGGGVFVPDASLTVVASTFDNNSVTAAAGGHGAATGGAGGGAAGGGLSGGSRSDDFNVVINSTITGNHVTSEAGGTGAIRSGAAGIGTGGGISENNAKSMTVANSTLAANTVSGPVGYGGNLYDQPTPLRLADDIFTQGVAPSGGDCTIRAAVTDAGDNLETSTGQCELSASKGDLIGVNPLLGPLAANGGPVPTMALLTGSPAIAAGGACLNYGATGNPLLTTDARGSGRTGNCDIGAFQVKPPAQLPLTGVHVTPRWSKTATLRFRSRAKVAVVVAMAPITSSAPTAGSCRTGTLSGNHCLTVGRPQTIRKLNAKAGANTVSLARKVGKRRLRAGLYRLTVQCRSGGVVSTVAVRTTIS